MNAPDSPQTIDQVISWMEAIEASTPAADGVACFNRMYLEVTRHVQQELQQGSFADPAFMVHLDVTFAGLYLAAVDAAGGPVSGVPTVWQPLVAARGDSTIEPIQFALAGMNAHINHDLPLAVVRACADLGTAPDDGSHHADYQKVDELLDGAEQSVRESFEPADVKAADRHVAAVLNVVANWSITSARDVAWDIAVALWRVRGDKLATDLLAGTLARTVAMGSRALLVAV